MQCRIADLRCKEVVNICDGCRLGYAGDLELKIPEAAPLWLAALLSDERLFPTGFSKYGTAYKDHILQELFEVTQHA